MQYIVIAVGNPEKHVNFIRLHKLCQNEGYNIIEFKKEGFTKEDLEMMIEPIYLNEEYKDYEKVKPYNKVKDKPIKPQKGFAQMYKIYNKNNI